MAKVPSTSRERSSPLASSPAHRSGLRAHVRATAEDRPGVYRMLDSEGAVLYVGKSIRVRTRLLSYFRAAPSEKAADIVRAASSIEWEYVPNEFWALIRELRLIKRWRPRYNVEHTRKARYAFIRITREPAPRVLPASRIVEDGSTYFGPFPRPSRMTETVRELAHTLGIRDCPASTPILLGDQHELFSHGRVPRCLRADTGSCLTPCAGRCTEEEYGERVDLARRFLEGRSRIPLERVRKEMGRAAERRDFEYAAILRDRAERLERLQEMLVAFRGRVESMTFVYRVPGFRGGDRLYFIRRGLVIGHMPHPKTRDDRAEAARRIDDLYGGPGACPARIGGKEAAEILLVARWFRRHPKEEARTVAPTKWLEEKRPA